jgi:electron transfer flavoprotein beta subunit
VKIVVCVKQVPDSWAEKKLNASTKLIDRESVDAVLNDLDEYAVESALQIVEANGGSEAGHSVTLISMGPERATEALRKGLSMGADDAVLVSDVALAGSDALATSLILAKVIQRINPDLILCGTESTDARMSVVPAMIAARLQWPQLTFAGKVDIDVAGGKVSITRVTEAGVDAMNASMPAVISVVEKINEPRYPSFKGIMAAKKKTIETRDLATVGATAQSPWSLVIDSALRPPRAAGIKVTDEGDAGNALVNFLAEKKLI